MSTDSNDINSNSNSEQQQPTANSTSEQQQPTANGNSDQQQPTANGTSEQQQQQPTANLRDRVIEALHTVYDPEIPVDIYELGLIYEVRTALDGGVLIVMTLTTPNCPSAQTLPQDVERAARSAEGVTDVKVHLTFDPPWDKTMMSEAALFSMGLF